MEGNLFTHKIDGPSFEWFGNDSEPYHNVGYHKTHRVVTQLGKVKVVNDAWAFGSDQSLLTDGEHVYERISRECLYSDKHLYHMVATVGIGVPFIEVGRVIPTLTKDGKILFRATRYPRSLCMKPVFLGKVFGYEIMVESFAWATNGIPSCPLERPLYKQTHKVIDQRGVVFVLTDVWMFVDHNEYTTLTDGKKVYERMPREKLYENKILLGRVLDAEMGIPFVEVGKATPVFSQSGKIIFHGSRFQGGC
jgi:hypothetical protein